MLPSPSTPCAPGVWYEPVMPARTAEPILSSPGCPTSISNARTGQMIDHGLEMARDRWLDRATGFGIRISSAVASAAMRLVHVEQNLLAFL